MSGLSCGGGGGRVRRCWDPIPSPIPCLLAPLFFAGLAVSVFVLVVVGNGFSLAFLLALSALVLAFVLWNLYSFRRGNNLLLFLDRVPATDLFSAKDGQIVKVTGFASCGDVSLESSYQKTERCIYSSTLLYERRGFGSKMRFADCLCIGWNLTYVERCIANFYITDVRSGIRALVKASSDSQLNPLVTESLIVNTSSRNRELSSTLKKWLEDRHLSAEARPLCLEEGYVREQSYVTVMGMLSRKNGVLTIVPPPEPITTGCLLGKCLLPVDVDGLVLRFHRDGLMLTSAIPDQNV